MQDVEAAEVNCWELWSAHLIGGSFSAEVSTEVGFEGWLGVCLGRGLSQQRTRK